ncbi:biosynthetic-type acetolactate synthase large subunit [Neobacillus citreus]
MNTLLTEVFKVDSMLEALHELGVECVFGCHNDGLFPTELSGTRYIQLQHEQAAVHAADGYARSTGKPGVVILTTAAGVTSGITGIATAYSDSVPIVVIAGPLSANPLNGESAKELDIAGITMPITKYSFKTGAVQLQDVLDNALKLAVEGRPGPVLVELTTKSVTMGAERMSHSRAPSGERTNETGRKSINHAKELIENARKPVLFVGGGVIASGAASHLREIAERSRIPVVSSMLGIGAMDTGNPLFLGMLGMHGTYAANKAVHHCNLLISIGVRFSDRVTGKVSGFSPKSKKIHVDIDPAEINKIISVDLPIVKDAAEFLFQLKEELDYDRIRANGEVWVNEAVDWKRTVPRFEKSKSVLSPQTVIRTLAEFSEEDTVVVTDVGQHQIWTAHHYQFTRPRTLVTSGGLGTMGYGLPAAIGAAAGTHQETPVLCVSGDGSFQMNLQELITAVRYRLPIKIAILNNGYLGMVRQWQELFYHGRYSSVKIGSPNFAGVAEAYGVAGFRARSEEEARRIIEEAMSLDGPALMEFDVVEEENVYPMVPPNHSNHQLILSR